MPCRQAGLPPTKDGGESPFPKPLGPIYPHYYLIAILYPPPGNDSEAKYGTGSTTGTRTEVTSSFKEGYKVSIETTGVSASQSFSIGTKDGTSLEVKKEISHPESIKSVADSIDHGKDTFLLCMNPQADVTQTDQKSFSLSWHTRDGGPIGPVPVTVEELQGRAPIPPWKQQKLAPLPANDRQQILSVDSFLVSLPVPAGNPQPKPPRFVMIDQKQLDGPDNPGEPPIGSGDEVSDETVKGEIHGYLQSASSEFLVGGKLDVFGAFELSLKVGSVLDYDHENTTEMESGTVQKLEVSLRTTTLGYHDVINVYEDTLFGSFAFVSVGHFPPGTEVVSGTVTDPQGHPVSNQRVLVRMPDGITRTVFTNARGIYRVFGGPVGTARVQIAGQERTVPIEAGKVHGWEHACRYLWSTTSPKGVRLVSPGVANVPRYSGGPTTPFFASMR